MASAPKKLRGKCDASLWTREKTVELIALFEARSDLWNVSSQLYSNRNHKHKLQAEIASKLDIDVAEVAGKLHNLRCQYNGELRKLKKKKSGSRTDELYVPRWEFFHALKFLSGPGPSCSSTLNLKNRQQIQQQEVAKSNEDLFPKEIFPAHLHPAETERASNCNQKQHTHTQQIHIKEAAKSDEDLFPEEIFPAHLHPSETERASNFNHKQRPSKRMRFAKKSSSKLQELEALNRCMTVITNATPTDEFSVFGDFVANELRNLKNAPDLQSKLKRSIQRNILDVADEFAQRQDTNVIEYVQPPLPSPSFTDSNVYISEPQ